MHDDFYFRLCKIGGTGRTNMYRDYLERLKEEQKQSGLRGNSSPDIRGDIGSCAYSAAPLLITKEAGRKYWNIDTIEENNTCSGKQP